MHRVKSITSWLILSAVAAGLAAPAAATDINLGKHITEVKVSGDLRLRQENFSNTTNTNASSVDRGRSRQRYRLRLGLEMPLHSTLKAKLRFASGTGEQVSTNQSFDNLSSQNPIYIDLAMLEYKPFSFLKLTGGRMDLPLWKVYSSDIVWDGDFSPMGYGIGAEKLAGPVNVFANGMYMVADEDSTNAQGTDQSEVSFQIGAETKLPLESRLKAAFAQHQWINERGSITNSAGDFTQNVKNNGNRRTTGNILANEFRVNELTADFSFWVLNMPVHVLGTFIKNIDALDPNEAVRAGLAGFALNQKKKDTGSQVGVILGKAGAAKTWEVAYFSKKSEFDATVADVADSDFGNGGTGRKGTIMWATYAPTDFTTFTLKVFNVKLEDKDFVLTTGVTQHDINRLQADFSVKF